MQYYQELGLEPGCSIQEVKSAYRSLSLKYHPDKGGDSSRFCAIQEAYRHLSSDLEANDGCVPQQESYNDSFMGMLWSALSVASKFARNKIKNSVLRVHVDVYVEDIFNHGCVMIPVVKTIACATCKGTKCASYSAGKVCTRCSGNGLNPMIPFIVHKCAPVACLLCDGTGFEAPQGIIELCEQCDGKGKVDVTTMERIDINAIHSFEDTFLLVGKGGFKESICIQQSDLKITFCVQSKDHRFNIINNMDIHVTLPMSIRLLLTGGYVSVPHPNNTMIPLVVKDTDICRLPFTKIVPGFGVPCRLPGQLVVNFELCVPPKPLTHAAKHHVTCALPYMDGEEDGDGDD